MFGFLYNYKTDLKYLLICVSLCLISSSVLGIKRQDKAVYGYSTAPYWSVGSLNQQLSLACQRREFSQKRQYRLSISFIGSKGRAITGVASKNWNLYDPRGLAIPGQTYHFFNDGMSNCAVYESGGGLTITP